MWWLEVKYALQFLPVSYLPLVSTLYSPTLLSVSILAHSQALSDSFMGDFFCRVKREIRNSGTYPAQKFASYCNILFK